MQNQAVLPGSLEAPLTKPEGIHERRALRSCEAWRSRPYVGQFTTKENTSDMLLLGGAIPLIEGCRSGE